MKVLKKNNGTLELTVSFADAPEESWAPPINLRRDSLPVLDALKRRLLQGHLEQADESLQPGMQRFIGLFQMPLQQTSFEGVKHRQRIASQIDRRSPTLFGGIRERNGQLQRSIVLLQHFHILSL